VDFEDTEICCSNILHAIELTQFYEIFNINARVTRLILDDRNEALFKHHVKSRYMQ